MHVFVSELVDVVGSAAPKKEGDRSAEDCLRVLFSLRFRILSASDSLGDPPSIEAGNDGDMGGVEMNGALKLLLLGALGALKSKMDADDGVCGVWGGELLRE